MAANSNTPQEDISIVKSLMSVGGSCDLIPENLINPCSAVCGSGPAFVSRDINSNLESNNNNNKSIGFKNITIHKSTSEPLRSLVDEKPSCKEVVDYLYREKTLSSSECDGSEHSSVDDSDVSLSENISNTLSKSEFIKMEERTANYDHLKKHRIELSKDLLKDYQGFDLRQKISSNCYRNGHSSTCNHIHKSEVINFPIIGESYKYKTNIHNSRELSRRQRTFGSYLPRYYRPGTRHFWDWERVNNNRQRYPDYYFRGNHFNTRVLSEHSYRSSVHSYKEYYREHNSVINKKDDLHKHYPFCHRGIGYRNCRPESFFNRKYPAESLRKRKMSDLDCIFSQPSVKRSRHSPAFHPLQVVIMRFNQQDYISQNMAARIRLSLILMVNSTFGSGFSPKFETTNLLRNGHFLISCSDECTVNWLLKQHLMEEDGTPFVIMKLVDLSSMRVVETYVAYNRQPVKHVLQCLKYQNPNLSTNKWLLSKRSFCKSGQFLRFFIDKDSFEYLEVLNWKPHFQLCRLNFHKINIQEEEICFLSKLFSTTCSICTFQ